MAAKYPTSRTAGGRGKAGGLSKPVSRPRPVPANDNRLGLVNAPPPGKKLKGLGPKLRPLLAPSPAEILVRGTGAYVDLVFDKAIEVTQPLVLSSGAQRPNPAYWVKDTDPACRSYLSTAVRGYVTSAAGLSSCTGTGTAFGPGLQPSGMTPAPNPAGSAAFEVGSTPCPVSGCGLAGYNVWYTMDRYVRIAVPPSGAPMLVGGLVAPSPLPTFAPVLPLSAPLYRPVANPAPRPFEKARPGEEPSTEPDPAPNSQPKKQPTPTYQVPGLSVGFPLIRFPVIPGIDIAPPDVVIDPNPVENLQPSPGQGLPGTVGHTANSARPAPPRSPRVFERKVSRSGAMIGIAWAGINTVTEIMDFIGAMHDALPKNLQLSNNASKKQVLNYMVSDIGLWAHINIAEGLQNFINMQIGDAVAAIGGQQVKDASQQLGIVTGLDRAINNNAGADARDDLGFKPAAPEIPQLDIDADTGSVWVRSDWGDVKVWGLHKN